MTPDTPREQVVIGSRVLAANGHADMVWGHLSVRDPDGRGVWIKRAGRGFDELVPEDVHLLSWDGELLEGQGPVHLEYHIHTEVMRARDDVGAVVHSHPEAAVTLAATGLPLQPLGHEGTYFTPPDVPRYRETGDLIRTPELGRSVAAALGDRNALLLVNHGVVVADRDMPSTVFAAVLLEKACRMQLAAAAATGGRALIASSDEEALAKRARCYSPSQLRHGWEYLLRAHARTAADLDRNRPPTTADPSTEVAG